MTVLHSAPGADVEARSPDTYDLSGNGGYYGGYYCYDPYTGYYYRNCGYGGYGNGNGDKGLGGSTRAERRGGGAMASLMAMMM